MSTCPPPTFEGREILKVAPEGLALLANEATKAINFMLRPAHLAQVAAILDDTEASENDRMVALMMLRNAEIAARGILPFCQDTGTAIDLRQEGPAGAGPAATTPSGSRGASTRPTPRKTSATRKTCR